MKDIRQLAMWGAVYILEPTWLEECSKQKREVETDQHQVPQNLLLQGVLSWGSCILEFSCDMLQTLLWRSEVLGFVFLNRN